MSGVKFRIKESPDKLQTQQRRSGPDIYQLLHHEKARQAEEQPTADSIEDYEEDATAPDEQQQQQRQQQKQQHLHQQDLLSPRTPAAPPEKHVGPSPGGAEIAGLKSAQRSFLAAVSKEIAFQRPQDIVNAQRGARRGSTPGSLAGRVSSLPVQTVGSTPIGQQSFTITSTQSEAHLLKCLCTPLLQSAQSEQVIVLLKVGICRSLSTSLGSVLSISPPWTELARLPGCLPVLIPWLVSNAPS